MKQFLITTITALAVSLLTTIGVWWWLQQSSTDTYTPPEPTKVTTEPQTDTLVDNTSVDDAITATETDLIADEPVSATRTETTEGIPLRDLPLSDGQKSLLETVGIDSEIFIITPEMIACAEEKLGTERFGEIVDGATPTFFEGTGLLGCVR